MSTKTKRRSTIRGVEYIYIRGIMCFDGHTQRYGLEDAPNLRKKGIFPVLIFEGGEDIHPSIYGEAVTHAYVGKTKSERDLIEMRAFEFAIQHRIPIFGICRGHQLLAALRGGKLYQDLFTEVGRNHPFHHKVRIVGSVLSEWKEKWAFVNSLHHQAVKSIPPGGEEEANYNGVNEAISYPATDEFPPMFGVQWHPEMLGDFELLKHITTWFIKEEKSRVRI